MKFSIKKIISGQNRRVHPEQVSSRAENSSKLREARRRRQVALQRVLQLETMLSKQRALHEKEKSQCYAVDVGLAVLENQRNEYVMYARQEAAELRHLESLLLHEENRHPLTSIFCTG